MQSDPLVSIIIANHNCESYLQDSLDSILNQSLQNLEIIFVDDKSTDNSLHIAREAASLDKRITVIALDKNIGPAGARNKALKVAQGEWIAIMDSDDLMHSRRISTLIEVANRHSADIVVDNILVFDSAWEYPAISYLNDDVVETHQWITVRDYIQSNIFNILSPVAGYGVLKPLIRRKCIIANNLFYDETLRNSEDYDFILRLMLKDTNYLIANTLGYFYRKHDASISYRINAKMLEAMLASDTKNEDEIRNFTGKSSSSEIDKVYSVRHKSINNLLSFQKIVDAIKSRNYSTAALELALNPKSSLWFYQPIRDKLRVITSKLVKNNVTPQYKVVIISFKQQTVDCQTLLSIIPASLNKKSIKVLNLHDKKKQLTNKQTLSVANSCLYKPDIILVSDPEIFATLQHIKMGCSTLIYITSDNTSAFQKSHTGLKVLTLPIHQSKEFMQNYFTQYKI